MKILIITDSLGLPRDKPELLPYNKTWCFLLGEKVKCHQCSVGGGTVDVLVSQLNYLKMFEPDYVIVQSGIVDCSPRALSKTENHLINKYWLTRTLFSKYSKRLLYRLRKRGKTYTSIAHFESSVKYFQKMFGDKVFWISILEGNPEYEKIVPGISKKIDDYNSVIKKNIGDNFIDLNNLSSEYIMSDLHHLNPKGHDYVYKEILEMFEKRNAQDER